MLPQADAFSDDPSIRDDELLYRRVHPTWIDWTDPDAPRVRRVAFQDQKEAVALEMGLPGPCLSVGLSSVLEEHNVDPAKMLESWGYEYGLASIRAGGARGSNQGVMRWPTEDEPWHGVVFAASGGKRSSGVQSHLAQSAKWVHIPERPAT